MARVPRKVLIDETQAGVYHCVQRAVRRAFLCGCDSGAIKVSGAKLAIWVGMLDSSGVG